MSAWAQLVIPAVFHKYSWLYRVAVFRWKGVCLWDTAAQWRQLCEACAQNQKKSVSHSHTEPVREVQLLFNSVCSFWSSRLHSHPTVDSTNQTALLLHFVKYIQLRNELVASVVVDEDTKNNKGNNLGWSGLQDLVLNLPFRAT